MNNRFRTDFLFALSSFTMGLGSVLNLHGRVYDYNACKNPDDLAIFNDWRIVGQDIEDSLQNARIEAPQVTQK